MKVWLCNLAFQNQNCQKYHNNKYKQAKWKSNNEANEFTKRSISVSPRPLGFGVVFFLGGGGLGPGLDNNVLQDQTVIVNL